MLLKGGKLDRSFVCAEFMQLFWNISYGSVWRFWGEGWAMKETQQAVKQDCLKAVNACCIQIINISTFACFGFQTFDLMMQNLTDNSEISANSF